MFSGLLGREPFVEIGFEIGILGFEVLEEVAGFRSPIVLEEELMVVENGVDIAGVNLKAELIGLLGGSGVAVIGEKVSVSDGHVGVIFQGFIAMGSGGHL